MFEKPLDLTKPLCMKAFPQLRVEVLRPNLRLGTPLLVMISSSQKDVVFFATEKGEGYTIGGFREQKLDIKNA